MRSAGLSELERSQTLGIERIDAGAVLYNGERQFDVRGIRIFKPPAAEDIWETLTTPST